MGRASKRWRPLEGKPAKLEDWGEGCGVDWEEQDVDQYPGSPQSIRCLCFNQRLYETTASSLTLLQRRKRKTWNDIISRRPLPQRYAVGRCFLSVLVNLLSIY